jgi:hypothetical protein
MIIAPTMVPTTLSSPPMITIGNTLRPTSATPKPPACYEGPQHPGDHRNHAGGCPDEREMISDIDTRGEGCLLVVGNCS